MKTSRANTTNFFQSFNQDESRLMRKAIMFAVAVFSLLMMSAIASAQVSVTATAGTLGPTPYTTVKLAFDAINAGTHQGAITIDIQANTSEGATAAVLNSSGAGSASFTSVLIRPTADGVSISGASVSGRGVIELNGADNVTIDGDNPNTGGINRNLTLVNTAAAATTFTQVVRVALSTLITNGNNNTVKNCILTGSATGQNITGTTSTASAVHTTYAILVGGGASTVSATTAPAAIASVTTTIGAGITATNFIADNNQIDACARGIAVMGSAVSVAPGLTVTNNVIGNPSAASTTTVYSRGLTLQGFDTTTISGNTLQNIQSFVGTSIMAIGLGNESSSGTNATVEKNIINNVNARSTSTFGAYGINLAAGSTITVRNNFVAGMTGDMTGGAAFSTTFGLFGIRVATGNNHKVYHNSVNMFGLRTGTATTSLLGAAFEIVANTQTGIDVRNNIFANTISGGTTSVAYVSIYLPSGGTSAMNLTLNNNSYYFGTDAARQGVGQAGTTAGTNFFTTLAALKAYSSTLSAGGTNDNASLASTAAAPFTSPTDLHIPAATATQLESGGASVGVTTDIDGQVRPGPAGSVNGGATAPDIGADEFDGVPVDLTAPSISYTPFTNTLSTADRTLSVTITDNVAVAGGANAPRIYYRKNGGSYVSNQCGAPTGSVYPCTIDNTLVGGVVLGDVIDYFVVAQDTAPTPNVAANPSAGFSATSVNSVTTPPTTPNTYKIVGPISGSFNVGAGETYTSLTNVGGIFEAINNSVVTGNITINITSDLSGSSGTLVAETGAVPLNEYAAGFSVTIQQTGGILRTIEGPAAGGLIRFNGADNVLVDGSLKFLRFRNTSSAPTFTFINDATNNQVTQCIIESPNISTTSGTVLFSTSTGTLGNSSNTISASDIRDRSDAAGVPANGVYSSGTASAPNGTDTISGCNIFNWTNAGVLVSATGAGNGWIINPSNFYQTAARTTAMIAISVQGGSGHSVLNNSIGGTAPGAGGSNLATSQTFRGIDLTVGTAAATSVQGNVIKNIRSTYPAADFASSYGIFLQAGLANIGNIAGNIVGSSNVAERYEVNGDSFGIRVVSTSTVNLSNNTVNNFGTTLTPPSGEFYFGISVEGTAGAHTVVNNTVTNVTNNAIPDTAAGGFNTQTIGMQVTATGVQTIRGNAISNIGSTNATAPTLLNNRVWGLILSGTGVGTVADRNRIDNIYASSTGVGARADNVNGLQTQTLANVTFTNNMISMTGGGASSDRTLFGILDLSAAPTIANYYFNSVNITGTATAANNTYAFNRNNTATVTLRDNIFADSRSGGTGFHVAMANTNPAATGWSATASNYNLLFNVNAAHITQWLGAAAANNQTLPGFQAASGGDANSFSANPLFVSASDLHVTGSSPALSTGTAFGSITVDFDNDPRPASAPDIGADEIVQAVGGVIPGGTYYNVSSVGGDSLGGNVTVTNSLYLAGPLSTGANTLTIGCNGTVFGAGPGSYVIGNLARNFCGTGSKIFDVGTANGYSPFTANATAGTFPSTLTAIAFQIPQPSVNPSTSIQRYWTLTESGDITADLTFQYLGTDVMGNEANYKVIRVIGGTPVAFPTSVVTVATHIATLGGVSNFSDWTVGEISAPTAAPATISGQVTTTSGAPLAGVTMYLSGARSGRTITDSNGNYRFFGVDTDNFYTVTPAIVNYHFSPASRSFSLLANKTDAIFTGTLDSVITGNVIDTPEYFVRQHYLDFLGREPDPSGLNFWSDQMRGCGNDFNCLERRTINVSAAYFFSIEFQKTGGLVDGLYRASYGRAPLYAEFMPDTATVAHNVIVGEPEWERTLLQNKQEFLDAWVQRADFRAAYDNLANNSYVETLISHTAVNFTDSERNALLDGLNSGSLSRAQVLQRVAENERFVKAKFNEAFVRMQYFGYLRRNPDDSGFHFWLNKLNEFDGNFERAEMVKAFIVSGEYRDRFRQ